MAQRLLVVGGDAAGMSAASAVRRQQSQTIGQEGAAKRIDVLATALWYESTMEELLNTDLSYAPPFSPLWDPVLIAARKAWQRVQDDQRTPDHPSSKPAELGGRAVR